MRYCHWTSSHAALNLSAYIGDTQEGILHFKTYCILKYFFIFSFVFLLDNNLISVLTTII